MSSDLDGISAETYRSSFEDYTIKSNNNLDDASNNNLRAVIDYIKAAHNNLECKSSTIIDPFDGLKREFEVCDIVAISSSIYQLGFNPTHKALPYFSHREESHKWV